MAGNFLTLDNLDEVSAVKRDHGAAILGWFDRDGILGGLQKPYVTGLTVTREGGKAILLLDVDTSDDADAMRWLFELPPKKGVLSPTDQAMVDAVRAVPFIFNIKSLTPKAA